VRWAVAVWTDVYSPPQYEVRRPGIQQPSETVPGDVDDPIQSGRSRGKSLCSSNTLVRIDPYQMGREAGCAGVLGVTHSRSVSRGGRRSVPSKPPWNPSPLSMPNLMFVAVPLFKVFFDNPIFRNLLPLRTRSKHYTYASIRWRSLS